ncbi:uncharacterized protein I303_100158 [Kwoniella dejecticola CBS 10117]|uniref:AMP-dependent synthetase/ligase domain-containing protein n=1 Tax=Kwoniella dejecticola CBS 10117 TaxID=1296121 RepID=A0A1A6AE46_9TREE|nr:uncharacterized protein I303_00159 [Kwoniella dejecticola CBS 10117]OBR88347.1 hypothetical protein I303_00159 [Kwoniella dejecticola CBS 10117]
MDIEIDNLTVILLLLLATLAIYHRFFSTPQPLVHPLLLGKQSDISTVRKSGETGIYRSWATGQGAPLTVRPANSVKVVSDIVTGPKITDPKKERYILDVPITDEGLTEITRLIPIGLSLLFPSTEITSTVILLPPSPSTSLPLLLLSIASTANRPVVILPSPRLLSSAISEQVQNGHPAAGVVVIHVALLEGVLEQLYENKSSAGVLVIGDPEKSSDGLIDLAKNKGINVRYWEEIWEVAESPAAENCKPKQNVYSDVHSYYYSTQNNQTVTTKVTHINVTAGIASLLSLFPADKRPSAALHDTVASAVPLTTPLGMTIALSTVWTGASFRLIGNHEPTWDPEEVDHAAELEVLADKEKGLPKPTILFISPKHHHALLNRLQYTYTSHPFASLAARHKGHSIRAGHIDRDSLWDRVLWSGMRENVLGGIAGQRLRGVILVGDAPPPDALASSHLLLSLPLTRLHPSAYSTGPVFVTHFYDLQSPGVGHLLKEVDMWDTSAGTATGHHGVNGKEKVHSGPPASNVEVLLRGDHVNAAYEDEGEDARAIHGQIWIRGPSVLEMVDIKGKNEDGWVDIGEQAKVQTNGTFIIDHPQIKVNA